MHAGTDYPGEVIFTAEEAANILKKAVEDHKDASMALVRTIIIESEGKRVAAFGFSRNDHYYSVSSAQLTHWKGD